MGNSNPRNRRRQRGDDDGTSDSDFILETVSSDDDGSDGFDPDNIYDADNVYPDEEEAYIPRRPKKKRIRSKKKGEDPSLNLKWMKLEQENEEWIDNQEQNTEEDDRPLLETANPSPAIVLPLLRFQKEFLAWALKQEQSEVRGGILADEMGMGKTIQAISLVLTSRGQKSNVGNLEASSSSRNGATLVICPVVAVIQWVGEIERYTEKGSVRVLVYHGPNRAKGDYDFSKYDFVITTYQTIEWDYRKNVMPEGKECRYCGKKYSVKSMRVHLLYHCGPNARKTEKQAKQKKKRKDDFENGKLKKGKNKQEKKKKKKKNVDDNGDKPWNGPKRVSLLHSVKWERIILDEAHFIKDRNSNTARAVFALDSVYKWALSGTPLQNRVGELYSLVRFLQVYPYANYFCKSCECNIFDHNASGSRSCLNCPHSITRHFCWWNRYINKPIQCGVLDRKRAMILLKGKVLKSIVLRRTKKGRAADLALPPRITCLRRDYLDKSEKEIYEAIYTQSRVQFDAYVGTGTLMNNYAHIFDLLTRLRQALDHPYLVVYSKTAGLVKEGESTATGDCGICHDPPEDVVVTSCDHVFCKACLIDYSASLGNVSCPSCSKPLTVDLTANNSGQKNSAMAVKGFKRSGIMNRIKIADFKTSTKIDALREEIRNMVENDSSAKGIVFSQFTSFLDLISFSLQMSGIKCVQLVGSMSLAEREKVIKSFTEDGECRIFLMSLKAGGVALNLTAASHVFLMDPWWNPAVERQAQDRIHRIGQYKPIRTIRFVIEDTIEERILKLQEKKELVFEGTVGDSKDALSKLTEADLRFLFQN